MSCTSGSLPSVLTPLTCRRFAKGVWRGMDDDAATETRITLHGPGGRKARLWAAPIDYTPLVLGHALHQWCGPEEQPVIIRSEGTEFEVEFVSYRFPGSTPPRFHLPPVEIVAAMRAFISTKGLWDGTGCFHRAAIYDYRTKKFLRRAEDIGRHNCLDRLAGWGVGNSIDLKQHVLFVSARMTASLYGLAARSGYPMIVSRSAVTTASVGAALEDRRTLCGFARDGEGRFTVFADAMGRVGT